VWGHETILERADGSRVPVIPYPKPLRDGNGSIVGVINMTVDISERKKTELVLAERNAQLALAGKVALVGSYAYDVNADAMRISEGYAAIHGLTEGTTETTRSAWRTRVHPEDVGRVGSIRSGALREGWREHNFEYRILSPDRGVRWIESRSFISYNSDGSPRQVIGVNIDVTERKRVEEQQRVLVAELDHRVKNSLATIGAVVSHTLNASSSMADFASALDGRIQSMARTHELLSARRWQGISVAELVRSELAPYATTGNTEMRGPQVILRAEAGQAIAMVLHELATNAAKYGALSTKEGRVAIRWERLLNGPTRSPLALEWRESGGPAITAPGKASFGTHTIRDLIAYEFGGSVDLTFAREGVQCRLELPANWLSNDSKPGSIAAQPDR
jgi:two-component sensor histidine kinase